VLRAKKEEMVATLNHLFEDTVLLVVTQPRGLTVAETNDLRHEMREAGAAFRVTKNRLARLALKGTRFEPLGDLFTGPTAVAISQDPVAAAKAAVGFAKRNEKLAIVGGALGNTRLDPDGVKALASLPSLDELRGNLLRLIATPATRLAGLLQAPGGQLARVLKARAEAGESA
jgi:large subunit ribosomal protein L10